MKRFIYLFVSLLPVLGIAQTTFDFETPATSLNFQVFGGNLEGAQTGSVANPDMSGSNTSASVLQALKATDAPDWGGMFANPAPAGGVDATNGGQVCMDVWFGEPGLVRIKLEMPDNADPANYEMDAAVSTGGEWTNVCFDLDANSLAGDMTPATGKMYTGLVFFPDFGTPGDGTEKQYFFDNITIPGGGVVDPIECAVLYDYETLTQESYQTFGAGADSVHVSADFIIPNPGPDAVNGSPNVMEYTKLAGSELWAGFFWNLETPLDASFAYEVCLDIWSAEPVDVLLKLENGDASQNWETSQSTTEAGAWNTLCYDLTAPASGGDSLDPATGKVYNTMVLFPSFGVEFPAEDLVFYIDNFLVKSDNTVSFHDVTFEVDMNEYAGTFTTVNVSGSFNDWSGDANPLSDDDGDGIWSGTVNVPSGSMEYKFNVDNWADQEELSRFGDCVAVFDDGQDVFINRQLLVTTTETVGPFCWSQCFACGESYSITWNVDFSNTTVGEAGPFVAGGCCFSNSVYSLTDDDGDDIYSLTIRRAPGFTSFYTFISDACGDFSCKENIEGQDCADPNNFNDRLLPELTGDVVINTCFGQCIDGACVTLPSSIVTFAVDMSDQDISADGVFLVGQFTGWQNVEMTDSGDNIYTYSTELVEGNYEYLFKNGTFNSEAFAGGESCTITTDDGSGNIFINRITTVDGLVANLDLEAVCFNECSTCITSVKDLAIDDALFNVVPTVSAEQFVVTFRDNGDKSMQVVSMNGQVISSTVLNTSTTEIDATALEAGVYLINVVSGQSISTKRVVVTK